MEEPVCVLLERLGRHEEQEDDEDVHRRSDHQRDQVVAHGEVLELASVSLRVGEPVEGGGVGGRRGNARQRPDHRDRCGGAVGVVGGHSYSVAVADREYAEMESCFNYL